MSGDRQGAAGGSFTAEEERLHEEGFARIGEGLAAGRSFDEACAALEVADAELRRVIVDDYLKVEVARRHFQGGESTEQVAAAVRVPVERVNRAREEMLSEVAARAVEVFRQSSGGGPGPGPVN